MVLSNDYLNGYICLFRIHIDSNWKSLSYFKIIISILGFINSDIVGEFNNLISSNYEYLIISLISLILSLILLKNLFKE